MPFSTRLQKYQKTNFIKVQSVAKYQGASSGLYEFHKVKIDHVNYKIRYLSGSRTALGISRWF